MKRINIILISLLAIILASCTSQSTPKQAVRAHFNALQSEEFYEAAKICLPTQQVSTTQQAENLRNKYSKFIKYYRILGVQQINDNEAVAVIRIKSPLYDITGDMLETINLTKEGDKWYVGKKPNKDLEELMRAYQGGDYDASEGFPYDYEDEEEVEEVE